VGSRSILSGELRTRCARDSYCRVCRPTASNHQDHGCGRKAEESVAFHDLHFTIGFALDVISAERIKLRRAGPKRVARAAETKAFPGVVWSAWLAAEQGGTFDGAGITERLVVLVFNGLQFLLLRRPCCHV